MGGLASRRPSARVVGAAVQLFARVYGVDLSEAVVPEGGYRSFDDFFTRRLRPGARPLDDDPGALLSPADGRLEDAGEISDGLRLQIKGRPYSLANLLGSADDADGYAGGRHFVVYLSPRDYHRVHAPVSGAVQQMRYVPGTLFPVNAIGTDFVPDLFARNERVVVRQASERHGEVSTILVGAIGVGRIGLSFDALETNRGEAARCREYGAGDGDAPVITRGDELGVFHLGSTAIVICPREARLGRGLSVGSTTRMGQALARSEA